MTEPCCAGCRAYVDRMLAEKDRWIEGQLTALQRAVDKAEEQMRERLAGMNEVREQLDRQARQFVTREALDSTVAPLRIKTETLWDSMHNWQGKVTALLAAWTLFLGLIGYVLRVAKW